MVVNGPVRRPDDGDRDRLFPLMSESYLGMAARTSVKRPPEQRAPANDRGAGGYPSGRRQQSAGQLGHRDALGHGGHLRLNLLAIGLFAQYLKAIAWQMI